MSYWLRYSILGVLRLIFQGGEENLGLLRNQKTSSACGENTNFLDLLGRDLRVICLLWAYMKCIENVELYWSLSPEFELGAFCLDSRYVYLYLAFSLNVLWNLLCPLYSLYVLFSHPDRWMDLNFACRRSWASKILTFQGCKCWFTKWCWHSANMGCGSWSARLCQNTTRT